jgi:MFS family permease
MALFALAAIVGSAIGATAFAYVDTSLGWRWIQWIQGAVTIALLPMMVVVMKETRASVILTRIARQKRKQTGEEKWRSRTEDSRPPMRELVKLSVFRPMVMLTTEPIVSLYSLWVGVAWGLLYGILDAVPYIFRTLYGFNTNQVGLAYLSIA